jgi:hypothetical protein
MNATHNPHATTDQPTSRCCDGAPETDADRRFFDLRDAGYTGPINHDGHPVSDPADPDSVIATEPPARVLLDAALYLERHGWITGAYYDSTAGTFTPPACMVGAIGMVCYGGPVDAPAQHFDDPGFLDFEEAVLHLDRWLLVEDGTESYEFNDARGRTLDDVTYVLRRAAAVPAEELIDALKAVNAADKRMAELLPDTPDEPGPAKHADYPHTPGTLYDCPACEAGCFCTNGFQCVHCALAVEQDETTTDATNSGDPAPMGGGLA